MLGLRSSLVLGLRSSLVLGLRSSLVLGLRSSLVPGLRSSLVPGLRSSLVPGLRSSLVLGLRSSLVPGLRSSLVLALRPSGLPARNIEPVILAELAVPRLRGRADIVEGAKPQLHLSCILRHRDLERPQGMGGATSHSAGLGLLDQ